MKFLIKVWKAIDGILLALLVIFACLIGAYYAMEWGYERFDWQFNMLLRQLITSILGFTFFGVLISIVSPFVRRQQMAFYQELSDALSRISRGDFRVTLKEDLGPMGQLLDDINDMAVNLKAIEDMRQEFISNVSHEIQSPLTSISGFARAMMYEELSREVHLQYLEIIDAESTRLSTLSGDFLRLTSLDSDHHPFHPEAYRLDKQLQMQILTFEPHWLKKELEINVNLAQLTINADKNLLSQVWVNLISNAIKFTPKGGTISVSLEQQEDNAVVCITDTGSGLSKEDQTHIFERFFKADKSRSRTVEGSGLGLSIVHKIVEMHQGNIDICSKLNEGTKFIVTLPSK